MFLVALAGPLPYLVHLNLLIHSHSRDWCHLDNVLKIFTNTLRIKKSLLSFKQVLWDLVSCKCEGMPFKIRLCRTSLTKIYALPRKVNPYLTHFIPLLNIRWLLIKRGIDGSSFQYEMKNNEITDFKFNENNNWCTNLLKLLLLCVCVCVCVCVFYVLYHSPRERKRRRLEALNTFWPSWFYILDVLPII